MIDWNKELDKVDEATKPIAEGTHTFAITSAQPSNSSNGNPMIKLIVCVEGGPDHGKIAYPNIVFAFENPRAMKMTMKRLVGLGISDQLLRAENPSVEQIAAKLIGRTVVGTVSHRLYNGEVQNDVDFLNSTPATPAGVPNVAPPPVTPAPTLPTVPSATEVPPTPVLPQQPSEQPPSEEPF